MKDRAILLHPNHNFAVLGGSVISETFSQTTDGKEIVSIDFVINTRAIVDPLHREFALAIFEGDTAAAIPLSDDVRDRYLAPEAVTSEQLAGILRQTVDKFKDLSMATCWCTTCQKYIKVANDVCEAYERQMKR